MSPFSRPRSDKRAFTLLELIVVIVILGVLAAIVAFSVRGVTDRGEESACKAEVKTVATAEEAYYAKKGSYGTLAQLNSEGFLRSGTPEYVASASAANGSITMVTGAPCDPA